jgi:hypothetical protein
MNFGATGLIFNREIYHFALPLVNSVVMNKNGKVCHISECLVFRNTFFEIVNPCELSLDAQLFTQRHSAGATPYFVTFFPGISLIIHVEKHL